MSYCDVLIESSLLFGVPCLHNRGLGIAGSVLSKHPTRVCQSDRTNASRNLHLKCRLLCELTFNAISTFEFRRVPHLKRPLGSPRVLFRVPSMDFCPRRLKRFL